MSDDAIHNSGPATNEQTETTIEKIVEQPNVTAAAQNPSNESIPGTASDQSDGQTNQAPARRAPGRPTLKMTKEQLMAAIVEITDKLGHVPSYAELMRSGKVSGRQMVKHFGTYTRALRACNLERHLGGHKVPLEKLFLDWARGGSGDQENSKQVRLRNDGQTQHHALESTVWKLGAGTALFEALHGREWTDGRMEGRDGTDPGVRTGAGWHGDGHPRV